ncbi:glycosyl transferase family group 2-domain-containing protein [Lipomyces orientalis]|uniref:Glycosyl transferase family group 2-domain-containing protein n=1 Tax=Lipomyces orientalis TaxID=1233043 RepID=A0ACC3TUR5_9ASCO
MSHQQQYMAQKLSSQSLGHDSELPAYHHRPPSSRRTSSFGAYDPVPFHHPTAFEHVTHALERDRPLSAGATGLHSSHGSDIRKRLGSLLGIDPYETPGLPSDLSGFRGGSVGTVAEHPMDNLNEFDEYWGNVGMSYSEESANDDNGGLDPSALDKYDIMCQYLYKACRQKHWLVTLPSADATPCVALRVSLDDDLDEKDWLEYRVFPPEHNTTHVLAEYVAGLNVEVCVRLSYPVINVLLSYLPPDAVSVPLSENTRIQVLESLSDLPRARKYQYAAFVKSEGCLLVWADDVRQLLSLATLLENRMMELVWTVPDLEEHLTEPTAMFSEKDADLEKGDLPRRPFVMLQAIAVGFAILLLMAFIGLMFRIIAREIKADGKYLRLLVILYIPPFSLFCAFFTIVIAGTLMQLLGPVAQMYTNSSTFSAVKPPRLSASKVQLPHVTIQCPVYKESLEGVIHPTMQSLLTAITTYELQGGSANIFVNDDGMQLIPENEAQQRREYYAEHLIGYVARPPHGKDGFQRRGRFKKASNMNYCLDISNRVEEHLQAVERHDKWTDREETEAYEKAFASVIEEEKGACWAAGDIRIGDIILIVDSDTRIPEDCFLDAASEFYHSPEVAILQEKSGVMMVVHNYWEELIAWFTRLIYFAIQYATSGGDAAAFVGHNAFLRWSAVQEIAYKDETDNGRIKYWSEEHVSEDFEMSLKLQTKGYIVRLITYHDDKFQEGVSLTVYDELTRWQKYAYGCSELVFHPVRKWYTGKIFTPLFSRFLWSGMKPFAKFTIIAYIGTYYAIAASLILTFLNYIIIGWFDFEVDQFYLSSFNNLIALIFVFSGACPVANALVRYRINESTFWHALLENYKWGVLMTVFLGGLSWHLNLALLSHMFGINMQWGATAKELETSNFFKEFPKIVKGFRSMYVTLIVLMAGMIVLAYAVPWNWRITGVYSTLPLGWNIASHFLSPIVLNPQLMTFSF